jgi:hypothetical protein
MPFWVGEDAIGIHGVQVGALWSGCTRKFRTPTWWWMLRWCIKGLLSPEKFSGNITIRAMPCTRCCWKENKNCTCWLTVRLLLNANPKISCPQHLVYSAMHATDGAMFSPLFRENIYSNLNTGTARGSWHMRRSLAHWTRKWRAYLSQQRLEIH